jgi:hypothetical protein
VISLIVSTIGAPFLLDALRSQPDLGETIVVLDRLGRTCSNLDAEYPIAQLEADLAALPNLPRLVFYDVAPDKWAVQNGCYNVGASVATNDWLLFTHDDVVWPLAEFRAPLHRALSWIEAGLHVHGERWLAGLLLPEWEVANQVRVPSFAPDRPVLCQAVSPVSQVIHVDVWRAIGGFDEEFGVWYDGQLEHESRLKDYWYIYLPTPLLQHQSNATYRINNWGKDWVLNRKWATYEKNFEVKYGIPPYPRKLSEWDPTELTLSWP